MNGLDLCLVVGYGNTQRRDDGLGPAVVTGVESRLKDQAGVRLITRPQLDLDLIEDLKEAQTIILLDATVESLEGGRRWERVIPDVSDVSYMTHSISPEFLLGVLESVHRRRPDAWLVSIQGDDFGFGEELTPAAASRARRVMTELVEFVVKEE
ncbi:MAG: hydrogenase maturation protease [Thermodesulfobacteriota bacterium]